MASMTISGLRNSLSRAAPCSHGAAISLARSHTCAHAVSASALPCHLSFANSALRRKASLELKNLFLPAVPSYFVQWSSSAHGSAMPELWTANAQRKKRNSAVVEAERQNGAETREAEFANVRRFPQKDHRPRCTSCSRSPARAAPLTGAGLKGPRLARPRSSNFEAAVGSSCYGGRRGSSQLGRLDSRCIASQVSSPVTENGPETSTHGGDSSAIPAAVKKRVVSGVQPTGSIHLGNYLGAIKNWVALQDVHDTLFFVVDLHAITMAHEPKELFEATRKSAAMYIACGVDPTKASIFVQSHVQAHADLTWLLSCVTPISWLNKMIQFKEKARKAGEDVGTGLLTYPLLMASDILLYQCDLVPVGEDQRQHLELTRNVAERVNSLYGGRKWKKRGGPGGRIFKVPDALIPPAGARVMSLTDGTAKMSKSALSDQSRINLLDSPDVIKYKITRCKTDSVVGMEFDNVDRPECNNLLCIFQLVSGQTKEEVAEECKDLSWGQFKPRLADALIAHLAPIQERYRDVIADPAYLDNILRDGAERAEKIANVTLQNAYSALGFLPRQRP